MYVTIPSSARMYRSSRCFPAGWRPDADLFCGDWGLRGRPAAAPDLLGDDGIPDHHGRGALGSAGGGRDGPGAVEGGDAPRVEC